MVLTTDGEGRRCRGESSVERDHKRSAFVPSEFPSTLDIICIPENGPD